MVNSVGLVYFETKIISRDKDIIEIATTQDYSIIQRREYSRVNLKQGNVVFKDMPNDVVQDISDISAGGIKLTTSQPLDIDKDYDIEIIEAHHKHKKDRRRSRRISQRFVRGDVKGFLWIITHPNNAAEICRR